MFLFSIVLILSNYFYSEEIRLKDGSVIFGDIEGEMDNYYAVRTKYGILSIPKSDIIEDKGINFPNGVNLKIEIKKSTDGYIKNFYEGDKLLATQSFTKEGVLISSSGVIQDGIYYEYNEDGNLISERTVRKGVENGPLIEFYPDGRVKARIDFRDGKMNGKAIYYSLDSKPILEQTYTNGVLDGFSVEYDMDGNVKTKVLYSSGKMVDSIVKGDEVDLISLSSTTASSVSQNNQNSDSLKNDKISKISVKKEGEISTRLQSIARGKKVFVSLGSKYTGSFVYDSAFNIIDITGKIPDGNIEVNDSKHRLVFEFSSNWPVSLKVFNDGVEIKKFTYDENGKASGVK